MVLGDPAGPGEALKRGNKLWDATLIPRSVPGSNGCQKGDTALKHAQVTLFQEGRLQ